MPAGEDDGPRSSALRRSAFASCGRTNVKGLPGLANIVVANAAVALSIDGSRRSRASSMGGLRNGKMPTAASSLFNTASNSLTSSINSALAVVAKASSDASRTTSERANKASSSPLCLAASATSTFCGTGKRDKLSCIRFTSFAACSSSKRPSLLALENNSDASSARPRLSKYKIPVSTGTSERRAHKRSSSNFSISP